MAAVGTASGDVAARSAAVLPTAEWDWNRLLTPRVVFLILPVVALVAWAYPYWFPGNRWELTWRNSSAWGHAYLIPFIAVLIAHYRLKERAPRRIEPCIWGLALILAGFVFRIWSRVLKYGYPGEATFLLVVAGAVLLLLGWEMFKALWIPVLYLGLMIPWDAKYYEQIALPLQTLAAAATEKILMLLGMAVDRRVNDLELSSGKITVAEACSGLHLLFAFVALGVMMAFIYRRPLWERVIIMASSVPIAVFCNMIRVTLMAIASDHLYFEARGLALGAPTWSAYAPRLVSWSSVSWGGLALVAVGLFQLLRLLDLEDWRRHTRALLAVAGWVVGGIIWVFWFSEVRLGYAEPAQLEAVRQQVLNPESVPHQAFGFAMLGLAFLIMWAELKVIDMFFIEEEKGPGRDASAALGKAGAEPAA